MNLITTVSPPSVKSKGYSAKETAKEIFIIPDDALIVRHVYIYI